MTTPTREELLALANAASKDGEHIYSNPRDHHNWKANETWHRAASPEAFIALLSAHQAQGEPVAKWDSDGWAVLIGRDSLPDGALLYAAPPSSAQTNSEDIRNQVWNEAVEAAARICIEQAHNTFSVPAHENCVTCATSIRSLKRPLQAQEPSCTACHGNEGDMPCAYPGEGIKGCLRDKRLASPAAQSGAVDEQVQELFRKNCAHYAGNYEVTPGQAVRIAAALSRAQAAQQAQAMGDEQIKQLGKKYGIQLSGVVPFARALLSQSAAPNEQPVAFPERDPSKPAEQQGMFRKFHVRRVDGSDQPGGKHHGCRYFVLDLDHDKAAPAAMRAYAAEIRATHQKLADDIEAEFGEQPAQEERFCSDLCRTLGNGPCPHVGEQPAPCGGKIGYYSARSSGFSERRCEKCGWRPPRELLDVKNCPRIPSNNQPAAQTAGALEGQRLGNEWDAAQAICDLPDVDEAIRGLLADQTGDNATIVVRAVMRALAAAPQPVAEQVGEYETAGWLQYIDGVKTQNFARDEAELSSVKNIAEIMGYTHRSTYEAVYRAAHPQAAQAKGGDKP